MAKGIVTGVTIHEPNGFGRYADEPSCESVVNSDATDPGIVVKFAVHVDVAVGYVLHVEDCVYDLSVVDIVIVFVVLVVVYEGVNVRLLLLICAVIGMHRAYHRLNLPVRFRLRRLLFLLLVDLLVRLLVRRLTVFVLVIRLRMWLLIVLPILLLILRV